MFRILTVFLLVCVPLLQSCHSPTASAPLVVSTIKPIQALVYVIAGGHLETKQLLPDGASPHHYAIRPSDLRTLESARIIFRIDRGLEMFLNKTLDGLPSGTTVVSLTQAPGIQTLPLREEHAEPSATARFERFRARTQDSDSSAQDLHIWLNPQNAVAMSREIARVLGQADPAHATDYTQNAARLIQRIEAADVGIRQLLEPVRDKPYLAFHDAWQHFDQHYGLNFAGAVTLDVSRLPGARHVQDIHQIIERKQAVCLFQEPQFPPALVKTLVEGTQVHIASLDPLGMGLALSDDTYISLIQNAARSFRECLTR